MAESTDFLKLENALLRAGRELTFPATPAIASRVRAELAASPRALRNVADERVPQRRWWRVPVAVAAALILALVLLLAFPTAREAVGQFLGLRGLQIFYVTPTPTALPTTTPRPTEAGFVATSSARRTATATRTPPPTKTPTGLPNKVCCEMTLAEVQQRAHFKLMLSPNETPSKVFYQNFFNEGEQVVMVFGNSATPRFVLYQAQQWVYGKVLGKMLGETTVLSEMEFKGGRALWISGAPHVVLMLDAQGNPNYETQRTVNANTLAWETDDDERGIIYRLETTGTLEQALKFAEALVLEP